MTLLHSTWSLIDTASLYTVLRCGVAHANRERDTETARRLLGGSWVVISGAISPLIWVITIVTLLIIPLITTHEPPSKECQN